MKKILLIIISILMLVILSGCGKKEMLDSEKFIQITEENNFFAEDITSNYLEYSDKLTNISAAKDKNNNQIFLYTINSINDTKIIYDDIVDRFKKNSNNTKTEATTNILNYSKYELTNSDNYMYVCRVDNTILYTSVNKKYKDDIKELIKQLGY